MINKVILIGNLGADPEMRHTQSGTPIANFRIACTERYRDRDGEWQERTEWVRIVAWARLAEICGEYLSKGRQVYIEGRMQTRSWEDRDGNTRYTTEVVAREMKMLGPKTGGGGGGGGSSYGGGGRSSNQSRPPEPPGDYEDDIPF